MAGLGHNTTVVARKWLDVEWVAWAGNGATGTACDSTACGSSMFQYFASEHQIASNARAVPLGKTREVMLMWLTACAVCFACFVCLLDGVECEGQCKVLGMEH